ncbi:MAG: adenylate/guanylate cyclase domain-containing protein, partial [Thermoplasmata archaeon]|nr:adenylate/guanylate cyclase domain-containing protein [Thermoplasmata archaeon]
MTQAPTTETRRLAAIMFTDTVGFTASAQANEARALDLRAKQQRLLRPLFAAHHGREVKSTGDGFLVEFGSALNAVQCAVEIQRVLGKHNLSTPDEATIRIRIGIHLGDVVETEGDVFGDSVNIASRIEPLAESGGICVTAQVFDQVQNKLDLRFERLGVPELKNVRVPIAVYRIVVPTENVANATSLVDPDLPRRMAVLPFTSMSPDPQDDFFADGLTEEIITELSRIPSLRVIARTSVMRYKTHPKSVREVGVELRVGNVLEGSVRKAGSRIRITAQLIDAATEEHLWSERFDRELADIFAVQAEIAGSVAGALDLRLHTPPAPSRSSPPNVEAYTLYLRGRFLWNQRTTAAVREALRRFEEAIAIDPNFPLAHSGVADCYSVLVDRGALPSRETIPKARAAAEKGLQLDPQLAEAHASLGLALSHAGDVPGSERELRAAIALNPGYAAAHLWLSLLLEGSGRTEAAWAEVAKAEDSDPLSPAVLNGAGVKAWVAGRNDEALGKWARALELNAVHDSATSNRIALLAVNDKREEAARLL